MQAVIQFVLAHEVVLAAVGVAVLDLLFALNPAIKANGLLHWIYGVLVGVKAPDAPKA